jgi:hypothetical protein
LANYRLYRLDGAGKIDAAEWIEAADDEQALQLARGKGAGHPYELWYGKRLVVRCPDPDPTLLLD